MERPRGKGKEEKKADEETSKRTTRKRGGLRIVVMTWKTFTVKDEKVHATVPTVYQKIKSNGPKVK